MALSVLQKLAERRISEAEEKGEFKSLPGSGKPLKLEDDSHIPPEIRLPLKVLRNAGFTPEEVELKNQIVQVEDLLASAPDEKSRYQALKRLNYLTMKLDAVRPGSSLFNESRYTTRLVDRLANRPLGERNKD
jgi:hypothetical protein